MPDMVNKKKGKRKFLPYIHYRYLKKPWYTLPEVIEMFKINEKFANTLLIHPTYRFMFDIYDGVPEISRDNLISLHKELYHKFSNYRRESRAERQQKYKRQL